LGLSADFGAGVASAAQSPFRNTLPRRRLNALT